MHYSIPCKGGSVAAGYRKSLKKFEKRVRIWNGSKATEIFRTNYPVDEVLKAEADAALSILQTLDRIFIRRSNSLEKPGEWIQKQLSISFHFRIYYSVC